ncbi:MAG: glycosyltransferase family 4 protein [Myxococcales bacterium]|nr:glycosyltransferase family 4 protein [Myxococcales bacterium]
MLRGKMKIGILTTSFPRYEGDCSGAFVLAMARAWAADGHGIRVLAPEPSSRRAAPRWPGIEVRWVPYARPRGLQRTFYGSGAPDTLRTHPTAWLGALSFTAAQSVAVRLVDDCDALVSHWCLPCGWVASANAKGRPHLSICHATDVRWLARLPGARTIAQRIAQGATSMWFLTTTLRDRFFSIARLDPGSKTTHIGPMPIEPPPILVDDREGWRRELGIEDTTLLFLGRLVPVKGVDRLIRAVARVSEDVSLRIAGDGPERCRLEALARDLGVKAHFEGWVHGARKEKLLRSCDALIVPSRPKDGVPTVIFEASARGLPVVATHLDGLTQHFPKDALVPQDDPAALTSALRELMSGQCQ